MTTTARGAACTTVILDDWREVLVPALADQVALRPDLLLVFASHHLLADLPAIVRTIQETVQPGIIAGATGIGIVGLDREYEQTPAIVCLGLHLPGATLRAVALDADLLDPATDPAILRAGLLADGPDPAAWLLLADPFSLNPETAIEAFARVTPNATVVGGMASPGPHDRETRIIVNGRVRDQGGVAIAIGGQYALVPLLSQGADPVGQAWTIAEVEGQWVARIGDRPALEVLVETLNGLPPEDRARVQRNLLVGLAADEYRDTYHRGDFLIRNIVGIDQGTGAIAVGAHPRVGQTIQFQVRDAAAADLDLHAMLDVGRVRLDGRDAIAGILCTCNGRGAALFGSSHHDARAITRGLSHLPLAGLFCAGEIGPVGGKPFLHGHTAVLAVLTQRPENT